MTHTHTNTCIYLQEYKASSTCHMPGYYFYRFGKLAAIVADTVGIDFFPSFS